MVLELQFDRERVAAVSFKTFGCGVSIACGSALGELIRGQSVARCRSLTAADVIAYLDGVPDDKQWCADVAVNALHNALDQWDGGSP
jgi:NifU-like protein involved in Fe-S cluster formation